VTTTFQYDSPLVYDSDQEYDPYAPSITPTPGAVLAHLAASVSLGPDGSFI
jgi:hypothetical protein